MSLARWSLGTLILMHLGQCTYPGVRCKHTALWRVVQFERLQCAGKRKEDDEWREHSAEIETRFANFPHSTRSLTRAAFRARSSLTATTELNPAPLGRYCSTGMTTNRPRSE